MKFHALICARSGSKGIKNKNIRIFKSKPLISYPIKSAQRIKEIVSISVSTDSKKIQKCELKNSKLVRKSIVAKININKNTNFNLENLTCKRPANGLSPFLIKKLLNKKSKKNYIKDQLIKIE